MLRFYSPQREIGSAVRISANTPGVADAWGQCAALAARSARTAFFNFILSRIFLYCETQATLLMTMTAIARPRIVSESMVKPPPQRSEFTLPQADTM
jgi:hypothetical protein